MLKAGLETYKFFSPKKHFRPSWNLHTPTPVTSRVLKVGLSLSNKKYILFYIIFHYYSIYSTWLKYMCMLIQRRQWHPTPVLLPGKSHGPRSLVGCSPWGCKSRTRLSDFTFTFHFHDLEKEMATHSSILAWRSPGTGEPGGLPSLESHTVGHDWSDLAAAAVAVC